MPVPRPGRSAHDALGRRSRPAAYDRGFFGHPRGLSTLFFTEMWERFSYYGMRALLILFMTAPVATGGLEMNTATAGAIYGMYTAMVYMMSLPGGWIADRLLGQRRAVLYGGIVIACGHFSMAIPARWSFYLGLVLIVLGTGLLKPNISVIVGQLYPPTTGGGTRASRCSTWASTSAPSSRRSSAAIWGNASTGTTDSRPRVSA